jgi:hypothetical protein
MIFYRTTVILKIKKHSGFFVPLKSLLYFYTSKNEPDLNTKGKHAREKLRHSSKVLCCC